MIGELSHVIIRNHTHAHVLGDHTAVLFVVGQASCVALRLYAPRLPAITPTGERQVRTIATAIANARGRRHSVAAIVNILDAFPEQLRSEVFQEAAVVFDALEN